MTLGIATMSSPQDGLAQRMLNRAAADTGPGVGGTREVVTRAPR